MIDGIDICYRSTLGLNDIGNWRERKASRGQVTQNIINIVQLEFIWKNMKGVITITIPCKQLDKRKLYKSVN